MKTTNNAQKTENRKFENPVSKTFIVVLSLVLFSMSVNASGFWKKLLVNNTFGEMTFSSKAVSTSNAFFTEPAKEKGLETENLMNSSDKTNNEAGRAESALQIEAWINNMEYNTKEFVDAEMSLEFESWMNSNVETKSEVIEAEPAFQIEALINNIKYNAEKFVADEMANEIKIWINSNTETK